MEKQTILVAEGINKAFAGIAALSNAEFNLREGEVHALVGANGAGKSTIIKILTGAYSKDSGRVNLFGKDVHFNNTHEARSAGISAVYQEFSLFNHLSVGENIYMGKFPKGKSGKIDWKQVYADSQIHLDLIESKLDPRQKVGDLSVGQKQIVEIAKAISNDSRVLILDEPTASLSEKETEQLFKVIRTLQKKGVSIIYVSHRLEELPEISDRVSVFRDGRSIITLPITEAPKPVIIKHMVGDTYSAPLLEDFSTDETILELRDFSSGKKFKNVNLSLRKGEVLGIAGLAGAGRTELLRAIFGVDPRDSGDIFINGQKQNIHSPADAKKAGLAFVTEDRKEEGLNLNNDLSFNTSLTVLDVLGRHFAFNRQKERDLTVHNIERLSIKTNGPQQLAKDLSGGNQQKVVIGKWLVTNPKILLLDEPTRGIDVGSKSQIYSLIKQLAADGIGVIVVSSDIPEILDVSNRIVVLSAGTITADIPNEKLTQEMILDYATSDAQKSV